MTIKKIKCAAVSDRFTGFVEQRLSGGYKILEGTGTCGGKWALTLNGKIEAQGDTKQEMLQEFTMAYGE